MAKINYDVKEMTLHHGRWTGQPSTELSAVPSELPHLLFSTTYSPLAYRPARKDYSLNRWFNLSQKLHLEMIRRSSGHSRPSTCRQINYSFKHYQHSSAIFVIFLQLSKQRPAPFAFEGEGGYETDVQLRLQPKQ